MTNCKHSECNAHVLRYLKAGIEQYNSEHCQKMMSLLQKMNHEKKEEMARGNSSFDKQRIKEYRKNYLEIIGECLKDFHSTNQNLPKKYEPEYIKLFRRLEKYIDYHLQFIYDFNIPFDNNMAERSIRKVKTKMKVSGQSININSANNYAATISIIETARIKGLNPLLSIIKILSC